MERLRVTRRKAVAAAIGACILGGTAALSAPALGVSAKGSSDGPGPLRAIAGTAADDEPRFVENELIVKYRSGVTGGERAEVREDLDATRKRQLPLARTELVRVRGRGVNSAVRAFERQPEVRYAEPNFIYRATGSPPNDTRFGELWGLENTGQQVNGAGGTAGVDINALTAWDINRGGGTVIAIADTGVAKDHPDLVPNLWSNPGEAPGNSIDDDGNGKVDDERGWDFVDDDNDPDDFGAHGTHVAGTAAAQDGNSLGVAGAAPDAQIMAVRVLDGDGSGTNADVADGIAYAAEEGADVINLSLGGPSFSATMSAAIDTAQAQDSLVVAAAGNQGANNDASPRYPCSYPQSNLICVAAIDLNANLASFSNFGLSSVDIAAPGVDVLSSLPAYTPEFSEDFESPLAGRWEHGGTNDSWARATARSTSPTSSIEDSPGGSYLNDTDSFIRNDPANTIDLSGENGCRLDYRLDLDNESDADFLEVGVEGSSPSQAVASLTGTTDDEFATFSHSVSSFDGDSAVKVRFDQVTDDSRTFDGAYIDDVVVSCRDSSYGPSEYGFTDGTSMATPHVAGTAALVRAAFPAESATEVATRIVHTVVPEPSLNGRIVSGGRVDAAAATSPIPPGPVALDPPPDTEITKGPKRKVRTKAKRPTAKFRFKATGAATRSAAAAGNAISFECKRNKGGFKPCASPHKVKVKAKRSFKRHTFRVRAVDGAGQVDPTPAKYKWKVKRRRA